LNQCGDCRDEQDTKLNKSMLDELTAGRKASLEMDDH